MLVVARLSLLVVLVVLVALSCWVRGGHVLATAGSLAFPSSHSRIAAGREWTGMGCGEGWSGESWSAAGRLDFLTGTSGSLRHLRRCRKRCGRAAWKLERTPQGGMGKPAVRLGPQRLGPADEAGANLVGVSCEAQPPTHAAHHTWCCWCTSSRGHGRRRSRATARQTLSGAGGRGGSRPTKAAHNLLPRARSPSTCWTAPSPYSHPQPAGSHLSCRPGGAGGWWRCA